MAFKRSLSIRSTLTGRRLEPCFTYVLHEDDRKQNSESTSNHQNVKSFLLNRSFMSSSSLLHDTRIYSHLSQWPTSASSSFCRNMSTSIGQGSENINLINDVAEVLSDTTVAVASQAPAVSEVAIAAADSYIPVAALQYVIDSVHNISGLNWWASIIVTTFLIRGITIPILINQLKSTSKLSLMRPRLEEIKQQIDAKSMDPDAVAEGQKQMQKIFKEYGVTPFTPLKGIFIQGPVFISFFLAISNMAEKMPSFKNGGAFWFTDLSTPDSLYIFPVLAGLTFLINVELNTQEGMEGNPAAGTIKNLSRGFALLSVPLTASFPKAIFCYWISSNLFSLMYGQVIKRPAMKKLFNIPNIPVPPPSSAPKPSFSLSDVLKKAAQRKVNAITEGSTSTSSTLEQPKVGNQRTSSSSSSAGISQRIRTLETKVKGRKKNRK